MAPRGTSFFFNGESVFGFRLSVSVFRLGDSLGESDREALFVFFSGGNDFKPAGFFDPPSGGNGP